MLKYKQIQTIELLFQIIWACMQFHICFHIQADTIKCTQIYETRKFIFACMCLYLTFKYKTYRHI